MTTNDAAPAAFPRLSTRPASAAGMKVPLIGVDGALTGATEDLDTMHLPDPVGHFLLVALPDIEARTAKGIIIPESVTDRERAASVVGTVIDMGPDCYLDPMPLMPSPRNLPAGATIMVVAPAPRFPSGPWCKRGDTVLFSRYAGKRFKSGGVEFRMLNDDEITATIPDGAKVGGL